MSFSAHRYDSSPDPPPSGGVSGVRIVIANSLPPIGNVPVVEVSPAPGSLVDPVPIPRSPPPLNQDTTQPFLEDDLAQLGRLRQRFASPSPSGGRGAHSSGGSWGSGHRRGSSGGSSGLSRTPTRRLSPCPAPQSPGGTYYGDLSSSTYLRTSSQSQPGSGSTSPHERGRRRSPHGYSHYTSLPEAVPPHAHSQRRRRSSSAFKGPSQSLSRDRYDETNKHRTSEQVIRDASEYTNTVVERLKNDTRLERSALRECYLVLQRELTKAQKRTDNDSLKMSLTAKIESLEKKVQGCDESTSLSLTGRDVDQALVTWCALVQSMSTLSGPSMRARPSSAESRRSSRSKSKGGGTVPTEGKDVRSRLGSKKPYIEEMP